MTDYEALRRICLAATPGPWEVDGQGPGPESRNMGCGEVWTAHPDLFGGAIAMPAGDCYPRSGYSPDHDMTFIATFNPVTVMRLLNTIADVEALCAKWDELTKGESPTTRAIRAVMRHD